MGESTTNVHLKPLVAFVHFERVGRSSFRAALCAWCLLCGKATQSHRIPGTLSEALLRAKVNRTLLIVIPTLTVFAGVLLVHQPAAHHARGASVTFLWIRADPRTFWSFGYL